MRKVYWTLFIALIATACFAQSQPNLVAVASGSTAQEPASRESAAVSTGERTVVGCVAQGANGYVLKTEDGRTLNLRGAATDLSAYMGKKVQVHVQWTSKGLHVAAPLESADATAAAGTLERIVRSRLKNSSVAYSGSDERTKTKPPSVVRC